MDTDTSQKLHDHVFDTYISLRVGMAYVAFAFPLAVVAAGFLFDRGLPVQDSLSHYYWATRNNLNPARIVFVGGLFAVGSFLYLYKGFTSKENIALNAAALFAIGVACFPMRWTCAGCDGWTPHGFCAIGLFACLVYVVWFRARDTLKYLPPGTDPAPFERRYAVIGACLAVSPLAALVIQWTVGETKFVIAIEVLGIWAFAWYWLVKGRELEASHATKKALAGQLPVPPDARPSAPFAVPAT